MATKTLIDLEQTIKDLTLDEKIQLLAGKSTWDTHAIDRLNIPSLTTSDGPHGVRGTSFFNGPPGCLLPSATAMGATFDTTLLYAVGELLAQEAIERKCHILLAPTVCLQRSPLIGRGFESFAEDPWLSGKIASSYINGLQKHGIAASIKHFAAHDQSSMSMEDSIRASQRTLREMHLYPFQIAIKESNPWSVMTSYHRINGVHVSEDPSLLDQVLRQEWGWDGLVVSDWFGTYSTAESVNAGMDLEMPGPSRWRADLLTWAVLSRKVKKSKIDERVRNLLNLINKVHQPASVLPSTIDDNIGNTPLKRALCRKVASDSIVLLKNEKDILPLNAQAAQTYGLIGPAVHRPAASGGGSADLKSYYVSTPYEAICAAVGKDKVQTSVGCYAHLFLPLLDSNITLPGAEELGYALNWYDLNPYEEPDAKPIHSVTTTEAQMYFADNLPSHVPFNYYLIVKTVYTAPKSMTIQLGLCVLGRGRLFVDGEEKIDLFTSQPPKTLQTPMFNQASMEVVADLNVVEGRKYNITVLLNSASAIAGVGAMNIGGLRVGCCEKIDPAQAVQDAVTLAQQVDIPIVVVGLNSDYEMEAVDRKSLDLPPGVDNLVKQVIQANPKTIVVNQSGCPVTMPWIDDASTLLHAWFGGQETGNAIADVLFGKVNPSGRLSVTFPRRIEDTPAFLTFGKGDQEIYYGEGVFIGYRYYEKLQNPPLFYFGYGHSYTHYDYSNLQVPTQVNLDGDSNFEVSVHVRNSGKQDGWEVVQVYIADPTSSVHRPAKELKGFTKVWVEKGQTVTARISLDKYALSFWSEEHEKWWAEKGTFQVIVARSADPKDAVLRRDFTLENDFFWSGV